MPRRTAEPPDFELDAVEIPQGAACARDSFEGRDASAPSGAYAAGERRVELRPEVLIAGRVAVDQRARPFFLCEESGPVIVGEAGGIPRCASQAAHNTRDGNTHDQSRYQHLKQCEAELAAAPGWTWTGRGITAPFPRASIR